MYKEMEEWRGHVPAQGEAIGGDGHEVVSDISPISDLPIERDHVPAQGEAIGCDGDDVVSDISPISDRPVEGIDFPPELPPDLPAEAEHVPPELPIEGDHVPTQGQAIGGDRDDVVSDLSHNSSWPDD